LLPSAVAQAARRAAESRRVAARGRRHGEVHVLRAADTGRRNRREGGWPRAQRRRDSAGMRAGLLREGARVRRPQRSRQRGLEALALRARAQTARRSRHASQSHLSESAAGMNEALAKRISDDLLRPVVTTTWRFWLLVAFLGGIVAMGLG